MKLIINGIDVEWYRCPIKLELLKHVVPIAGFSLFIGIIFGFLWKGMQY